MTNLSPPQRTLCVVGGLGRKKYRARGARWEGEREKRSLSFNVLFSHRPPRAFHFSITAFFSLGYPAGASAEEIGDLLTLLFCDVFILCGCL